MIPSLTTLCDWLPIYLLVKRYTNLSTGIRTVTVVSGSCFKYTPFRMYNKLVLAGILLLAPRRSTRSSLRSKLETSSRHENLAYIGTYPKPPGNMKTYRSKARINSMYWLLPLISSNKFIECLISDDVVMEKLCDYHIAAGDWGQDMYNVYLAEEDFVDGRDSCPVLPTLENVPIHQDHDFPLDSIFSSRTNNNMNDESRILEECVNQVRSVNEHKYWATNTPVQPADYPVPMIITQKKRQ